MRKIKQTSGCHRDSNQTLLFKYDESTSVFSYCNIDTVKDIEDYSWMETQSRTKVIPFLFWVTYKKVSEQE